MFNLKGNDHRWIVGLAHHTGVVFFQFLGTHLPHDAIDAETIEPVWWAWTFDPSKPLPMTTWCHRKSRP